MNIEEIEQLIIDRLQEEITTVGVELYPDLPTEYEVTHPNGVVLVRYSGDFAQKPAQRQQLIDLEFTLTVITRSLRTENGAYDVIRRVKEAMTTNLYIHGSIPYRYTTSLTEFDADKGLWMYDVKFRITTLEFRGM